jgi:hypothetical protein
MLYVDFSSSGRKRAEQQGTTAIPAVTYNIGTMHNFTLQHISPGGHALLAAFFCRQLLLPTLFPAIAGHGCQLPFRIAASPTANNGLNLSPC